MADLVPGLRREDEQGALHGEFLRWNKYAGTQRHGCVALFLVLCCRERIATLAGESVMVKYKAAIIGACAAMALAAAPVALASAHGYHHGGLIFGLAALGAAAVVGAATIVTAPVRLLAAPFYGPGPGYYAPGPGYYAPAPQYYAPQPYYYAPPPGYYYGR
jgi:hypothetical protein